MGRNKKKIVAVLVGGPRDGDRIAIKRDTPEISMFKPGAYKNPNPKDSDIFIYNRMDFYFHVDEAPNKRLFFYAYNDLSRIEAFAKIVNGYHPEQNPKNKT